MSEAAPSPKSRQKACARLVGSRRRRPVCQGGGPDGPANGLLGQVPPRAVPTAGAGRARSSESEDPALLETALRKLQAGDGPENIFLGDDNWPPPRAARRRGAAARAYRVGPSSKAACISNRRWVTGGLRELGLEEASRSSSGRGARLGAEVRVRSTGYGLALSSSCSRSRRGRSIRQGNCRLTHKHPDVRQVTPKGTPASSAQDPSGNSDSLRRP